MNNRKFLSVLFLLLSVPALFICTRIIDKLLPDYNRVSSLYLGFSAGAADGFYYMLLLGLLFTAGIAYLGRYAFTIVTGQRTPKPAPPIVEKAKSVIETIIYREPMLETLVPVINPLGSSNCANVSITCKTGTIRVVELIRRPISNLKFDIVFLIDTSGSMSGHLSGIRTSISQACTEFASKGADVCLGGVYFAAYQDVCYPTRDNDFQKFRDWLNETNIASVSTMFSSSATSTQDALEAIPETAYRPDAKRVFITVADDDNHEGNIGLTRKSRELSKTYPDALWVSVTTANNRAKQVSDDLKGLHVELPRSGNLDLNRINFVDLLTAETIARIKHKLPRGNHKLNVVCLDTKSQLQDVTIDVG
jgi:hypothetical protein